MRKILLMLAIIGLTAAAAPAATVTGVVLNAEDQAPLEAATVTVVGTEIVVTTDDEGQFTLLDVELPVAVTISHVGFSAAVEVELQEESLNEIVLAPVSSMLNSIVVTARRYEKAAYKVSQPITVVNSEEIEAKGHAIISDAIRNFPGLDMNDAGPFRARPVIRGLYGTRILVLVDGERLNDQRDVSDFAGASMSLIDANEIERVEVVNGPASVLYGSDAMAGVINIITKKNQFNGKLTPVAKYSGRYSTADEQHSNRIDFGLEAERFSLSVGYQHREARNDYKLPDGWQNEDSRYEVFRDGFYDSLNAAQGTSFSGDRLANSRARINNFDARLGVKVAGSHRLDFDFGAFQAEEIGYPGVPNEATPFLFFYPNHDRDNFSITHTATGLTDKLIRLETKFYYEKISKDFLTDFLDGISFPAGPYIGTLGTSMNHTEVEKLGLNFQELYQMTKQLTMTFGLDAYRESIDGGVTSTTDFVSSGAPIPPFSDTSVGASVPENTWYSLGAYASGEIDLKPLLITAGLRFDNYRINTSETDGYVDDSEEPLPTEDETYRALNGSLGIVYPLGRGVNAVANAGTAYRVPNVVERFFFGSASSRETRPNPEINPERSISLDFGVKAVHDRINYSLIGFWSDYQDFTQLVNFDSLESSPGRYSALWRYENLEDVTIYGFEGIIEGAFENGIYGNLSAAYQHGQNNTDDQPIFVSPVKLMGTAGYRHDKHGFFGEVTVKRAWNQDRIPDVTALDDIATKGFTVVGATMGVEVFKQVRLAISGNNLFDEVYSEPFNGRNPDNPIPESGRNFVISVISSL
ncbi:MAG: TonB-dependent receptor [bacterium]|nr:TonB-dependent receptor [bacterium]